jgi:hypothetical protein
MTNNILSIRIMGAYSCDAYGANAYSASCTTGTSPAPGGGMLADTGYSILLPLALGLALVIASVILLVKRLRRRAQLTK